MMNIRIIGVLGLAIIAQIIKIIRLNKKLKFKLGILHQIIDLAPISPTQITKQVFQTKKFLLEGILKAGQKCTAILNPDINIVYSQLILQKFMKFKYSQSVSEIFRIKRPSFLTMTDLLSKATINIYETTKVKTNTTEFLQHSQSSYTQNIKQIFRMFANIFLKFTEFPLQEIRQNYLPEGSRCLVLGEFTTKPSGEICCINPDFISTNKSLMINDINRSILGCRISSILYILGIGVSAAFLIRETYQWYLSKRRVEDAQLMGIQKIKVKSRMCAVCSNKLSCIINKTCSHMNVCSSCKNLKDSCVECSKKVKQQVQVYVC